jgi:hypothetical protein
MRLDHPCLDRPFVRPAERGVKTGAPRPGDEGPDAARRIGRSHAIQRRHLPVVVLARVDDHVATAFVDRCAEPASQETA